MSENTGTFSKMKEIMLKEKYERLPDEVDFLYGLFANFAFFKERGIQKKDMTTICRNLDYESKDPYHYVFKHGDDGDSFQMIIKGQVTVWIPLPMAVMVKYIEEFRGEVMDSIYWLESGDELSFGIKVHLDPWKEDDQK